MSHLRPGRVLIALFAVVAAVAVAACGSSSHNGSSSGGSAASSGGGSTGSSGGSGPSGGTIKIMTLAISGSPVATYPEVQADAQAAVDAINKAGGVGGKKVEDIFCNSKGDVNQAQKCAREAVSEHVVAAVGDIDVFDAQTLPIFSAAGIPVVGEWNDGAMVDNQSSDSYLLNGGSYAAYSPDVLAMKAQGVKKIALVALDFPDALAQLPVIQKTIAAAGLQQAGSPIKIPLEGVSDYSPYAQQVKASGAEGVIQLIGPGAYTGMQKAYTALGIHVTIGECEICDEAGSGVLWGGPYPLATDTSNPGIATFNKELVADGKPKVSPTDAEVYSGLNAWVAVHAFADVAKTIKGQVTSTSLKTALDHTTNLNVEGLVKWSPSTLGSKALGSYPRVPAVKGYVVKVGSDGKTVKADNTTMTDAVKAAR